MKKKWIEYFFRLADTAASASKDPRTKVGAVAVSNHRQVVGTGYNGFPRGVYDDPEIDNHRYEYPAKQDFTVHAEQNIVALAAYHGVRLADSTVFCTLQICPECAKLLIQAGVKEVHVRLDASSKKWIERWPVSLQLFKEAGVGVHEYEN